MDKTSESLQYDHLRVELFKYNVTRLKPFWDNGMLLGTFWCVYWNDHPGAGVWLNGKKFHLVPDCLYLLPPDADLRTYCDSDQIRQFYCHFYLPGYRCSEKIIPVPLSPELDALRERAVREMENLSFCTRFTVLQLISGVLYEKADHISGISEADSEMESIRRYLQLNLGMAISLSDLVRRFHIPEAELSRRFLETYNLTPYRYLSLLRYEHAAMLLRSTDDSIKSICRAIACTDRNYFTRCFKHRYGISPAAYRISNREV